MDDNAFTIAAVCFLNGLVVAVIRYFLLLREAQRSGGDGDAE